MKKLTTKQKADLAMLENAIELVRKGGHLVVVHVCKTKVAYNKRLKLNELAMRTLCGL